MIDLTGIFPPLPTSYRETGELYPEKIRENITCLLEYELAGILVLGSNGELVLLSDLEKEMVYECSREAIPADRLMIAGTGGQSTRQTIQLTRAAVRKGADAVLVLNPFYYKGLMTKDILVQHYHNVADASEVPLIIYNMPANTGLDMDAETIIEIADHPNIVGIKDSGGNIEKMGNILMQAETGFQVLSGSAGFFFPALSSGAAGGILALANIAPGLCMELFNAFQAGELDKARELQYRVIPINHAITRKWGIPALKAAMDHLGMYGGPVRAPLQSLDDKSRSELIKLLKILD